MISPYYIINPCITIFDNQTFNICLLIICIYIYRNVIGFGTFVSTYNFLISPSGELPCLIGHGSRAVHTYILHEPDLEILKN